MPFPRIRRRRLLLFFSIVGPGIITASVDQDAGGIATYSLAGAHYGYALLWTILFTTLASAVIQEMGERTGVVTGKGLAELIREKYGVRVTLAATVILILANLANTISEFAGVAASSELFGVSRYLSVPAAALLMGWLVLKGTYYRVERIFLGASVFYLVYVVSAFLARPAWGEVLAHAVRPTLRADPGYVAMVITLAGSTIAPWMQFYIQSACVDKGIRVAHLRYARLDAYAGAVVAGAIQFFIIVACGATLYPQGIRVASAEQAALAIEPFAGTYASVLFALGLLNASLFSAAIVPLSTAYAACESMGWQTGVDRSFKEAPTFFGIYLTMIAVAALCIFWPRLPLIPIMVLSQTLNGILLPAVLVVMLRLVNDPEVMGRHVNSPVSNLVAWSTAAVLIGLSLALLTLALRGA
jgi:Mn2+/Fe2+ NRAMP family transporter